MKRCFARTVRIKRTGNGMSPDLTLWPYVTAANKNGFVQKLRISPLPIGTGTRPMVCSYKRSTLPDRILRKAHEHCFSIGWKRVFAHPVGYIRDMGTEDRKSTRLN